MLKIFLIILIIKSQLLPLLMIIKIKMLKKEDPNDFDQSEIQLNKTESNKNQKVKKKKK